MTYTVNILSEETGADRRSIKKWLNAEFADKWPTDKQEALDFINERKDKKREGQTPESNIDPKTGLTWFQVKQQEEALKLRRENKIADKLADETYMLSEDHHAILSGVCGKLEQIPAKAKSELGLSEAQRVKLQRMIDEARNDSAKSAAKIEEKSDAE